MPSQITHLAIAKRYLAKHPTTIKDVQRFLDGNILPDLHPNKSISHCGVRSERFDVVKRNREKVNPGEFLRTHDMTDDLNKGQYLHILTDDQYYNVFLLDYFRTTTMGQSGIDMYETTRRDDAYLMKKYGVAYQDSTYVNELIEINALWDQKHAQIRKRTGYHFVIPYEFLELDQFIESITDLTIPV